MNRVAFLSASALCVAALCANPIPVVARSSIHARVLSVDATDNTVVLDLSKKHGGVGTYLVVTRLKEYRNSSGKIVAVTQEISGTIEVTFADNKTSLARLTSGDMPQENDIAEVLSSATEQTSQDFDWQQLLGKTVDNALTMLENRAAAGGGSATNDAQKAERDIKRVANAHHLGAPVTAASAPTAITAEQTDGFYREYSGGSLICWTSSHGAHFVRASANWPYQVEQLGFPTNDEGTCSAAGAAGAYQTFEKAQLYYPPGEGTAATVLSVGAIGPDGVCSPTATAPQSQDTTGAVVGTPTQLRPSIAPHIAIAKPPLNSAAIRHEPQVFKYVDHDSQIAAKAREVNLGNPRPETRTPLRTPKPHDNGYFQHFDRGSVYWSPATGAHAVYGLIRDKWAQQGWEQGPLGFPTSDEQSCTMPDNHDRYNTFEGGTVYWQWGSTQAVVYPNPTHVGQGGDCRP